MNRETTIIRSLDVVEKLLDELSESAQAAADRLKADPETERILTTIAALDMMRQIIKDLESDSPQDVEAGLKMFLDIERGPGE